MTGLFALDIDDAIWKDVGLADEDLVNPPLWMCDEDVRRGIKALLELDHCLEEEARLVHRGRRCKSGFQKSGKLLWKDVRLLVHAIISLLLLAS
jgi:hypothetical protein